MSSQSTDGPNRMWTRSPVGSSGRQFYLYWAPRHAIERQSVEADVYARCVQHHDDTRRYVPASGMWYEVTPETLYSLEGSGSKGKGRYAEGG